MAYSAFDNDYKNIINNIIRDLYADTEYWGVGEGGNQGIVRPITENDDQLWSNYNYVNTNWIVKNKIVFPYIDRVRPGLVENLVLNARYDENEINGEFFKVLWEERENIFGLNSTLKNNIINIINKTRNKGDRDENFTKLALESIPGFTVSKIAQAGGSADFMGIDLTINSTNGLLPKNSSTAQVKPFNNFYPNKKNWYIYTKLIRTYNTDLMIFTKQSGVEVHVAVFLNDPKRIIIEPERVIIPSDLVKLLINYNYRTKKSNYKSY
jgi:hypothetical protein